MPKAAISVTLEQDNLLWLRSQTAVAGRRSLSETLDQLVTGARQSGRVPGAEPRSVVGTIDINPDDPDLAEADGFVRGLFRRSTGRPMAANRSPRRAPARTRRRG
jgi:hypothetical protein